MPMNDNKKGWYLICLVFSVVILLWVTYPVWSYLYKDYFYNTENAEMGVFGDSYGALNTLFSALAFTGIIASIYFQREELKATREELEATRNEMNSQSEQFKKQTESMYRQIFENTFYSLISMVDFNLDRFSYETHGPTGFVTKKPGNDVILEIVNQYMKGVTCLFRSSIEDSMLDSIYDRAYERLRKNNGDKIRSYMMAVYYTLAFIDESNMDFKDKKFYSNIFRSRLSTGELKLIFFCSISIYGREKLKLLVEKYSFLEHLDVEVDSFFVDENIFSYFLLKFDVNAFGKSNRIFLDYFEK